MLALFLLPTFGVKCFAEESFDGREGWTKLWDGGVMIGNKMVTEHFESFQQLVGSVSEWRLYEDLRILRILWVNERWKAPVSNYLGKRLIRLSVWFWFWNLLPVLPWVYLVIGHLRQESEVTMENGELGDKVWKQLLWPDNWCLLVKALFTRQRKIPLWLEFCLAFKDENRFSLCRIFT